MRTDAGPLKGPVQWLRRAVFVPDVQLTWLPAALLAGLRALRRQPPDLLYSTYPPASAHLLGLLLKGLTGRPWVADFRDSWIYDPLDPALGEMPYRQALEARLEEAVIRGAEAVIAASEISAEHLRQAYPEEATKVQVIPNGFDPDEFRGILPPRTDPRQNLLRIVHTGSFARSHPQRTPQPLFAALEDLVAEDPVWATRLRLVLAGHLTAAEEQAAGRLEQAGVVQLEGPLERAAVLACQQQADVLLLVDHPRDWPGSNVPAKFYEYLAMKRPILALSGPGMVARLVRELGAGFHLAPDDPGAIRRGLIALYERFRQGELKIQVDEAALRRFHRRELTRELAGCFDRLLETGRGV